MTASVAGRRVVLIDLDGVLFDANRYEPEWERLAGEIFTPLLGGDPARWAVTQRVGWEQAATTYWDRAREHAQTGDWPPRRSWEHAMRDWVVEACRQHAIEPPSDEEASAKGRRAMERFFELTTGMLPDVGPALARLARRFELHMSSGNPSFAVESALHRIGAREHVGEPFGSDLAGAYKGRPATFYEAILAKLGAPASAVVVIDDSPVALDAARGLGTATVHIGTDSDYDLVTERFVDAVDRLLG